MRIETFTWGTSFIKVSREGFFITAHGPTERQQRSLRNLLHQNAGFRSPPAGGLGTRFHPSKGGDGVEVTSEFSHPKGLILAILVSLPIVTRGQSDLHGKEITSIDVYDGIVVAGTNGEGVFYQSTYSFNATGWISIGLEDKNVTAVYAHKSGPLGWGITAGVSPEQGDSVYVYCSFMGEEFIPNSSGISASSIQQIHSLAGFPDPSICGEKFAAAGPVLYRQLWTDSLWTPVWDEDCIEGCQLTTVRTREDLGGFVLAGGDGGMGGDLLIGSTDYFETWEYLGPGVSAVVAIDFNVDSDYMDFKEVFVSHGSKISRSLDGGETWEIIFDGGSSYYVYDIVYDPSSLILFASGGLGTFLIGHDAGDRWTYIYIDLNAIVIDIELGDDGYLYYAVPPYGVQRMSTEGLSIHVADLPLFFLLQLPYPNPFNPTTTIEFFLPQSELVTLTVFDLLGREVETILNQHVDGGRHKVQWNGSSVPSGIYLLRMKAGDFSQVRKVMVLR